MATSFDRLGQRVPTSVGRLTITLTRIGEESPSYSAAYNVTILDADGALIPFPQDSGDLVPHLTQAQIDALVNFINTLWDQARAGFIGS